MAPTNEKLQDVRGQISETVAHIEALKLQVQQAESKLQRLLDDEAAMLKTSEDHRRVLSAIRIVPEDVLREICIACVEEEMPRLSYCTTPLPYVLAQISRGMRHIALATSAIWASMDVQIRQHYYPLSTVWMSRLISVYRAESQNGSLDQVDDRSLCS